MNRNYKKPKKKKDITKQITIFVLITAITTLLIIALTTNRNGNGDTSSAASSMASETQSDVSARNESDTASFVSESGTLSQPDESIPDESEPNESQQEFSYSIDITLYAQYIDPVDVEKYLILVNSQNTISSTYVPENLVTTVNAKAGYETTQLNATADKALEALLKEAAANGYKRIRMSSGYRSYALQSWWFNYYVEQESKKEKNKNLTKEEIEQIVVEYSARSGTSEHQTGLAVDIYDTDYNSTFAGTPSANWLAENAHKFGFILRYPEGKKSITGIKYESWHFRFVGRTVATEIYERDWTLEEYIEAYN
ncbi:MAG: hypothetical protein A2Y17_04620 [Clostridiales bacterium GWF2_38_85]|nr:MAG: hypothetical protein A2Y17_04620 [Clostridiales bacterium GWF2_38_85]HBL84429.1 hypothetical protein [Clostridiales bacterium]